MLDPNYIVGFVDGEGCFSISISRKQINNLQEVRLIFEIELREDDIEILLRIREVLNCGHIYHLKYQKYDKWRPHVKFKVSSFKEIKENVIPFFLKYPLQAKKKKQFELFCKVAYMIGNKDHLTSKGIEEIQKLRSTFREH